MSNVSPIVSVIIPTKNRRLLLEETLESVRAQNFSHWEVIVVDDGPTDDTDGYMNSICLEEPRIQFFHREGNSSNANVCRNQGFEKSLGEYVIFLDSDDLLAPNCLEQRVGLLERNPDVDFAVYPGMCFYQEPGDSTENFGEASGAGELDRLLGMDWPMQTTAPIWRRKALNKLGPWDESLPSWQDVDFHFRALISNLKMLRVNNHDYYFRISHDSSKTSTIQFSNYQHLNNAIELFRRFRAELKEAHLLTWSRGHLLAGCYLFVAEKQSEVGNFIKAHKTWRETLRLGLIGRKVYLGGVAYLLYISFPPLSVLPLDKFFMTWKWKWRLARGKILF